MPCPRGSDMMPALTCSATRTEVKMPRHSIAGRLGQKLREDEEPQEHLHDERDVAEDLDVEVAEAHRPFSGRRAQRADRPADGKRDHPGRKRRGERPAQADDKVMKVGAGAAGLGLEQDLPVPVVVQSTPRKRKRAFNGLKSPLQRAQLKRRSASALTTICMPRGLRNPSGWRSPS